MDRSVRWSVDQVRWTGPRTGGQCFRVTRHFRSDRILSTRLVSFRIIKNTHDIETYYDTLVVSKGTKPGASWFRCVRNLRQFV